MDKIKIGIVGLNFGKYIIEDILSGLASEYFQLAAVCDMDAPKVGAMAEKTGARAFTNLDDLLRTDLPAIGLYTGPVGRAGLIRQIIRAGKDVITTKPFELDPVAALDILHEAQSLGRIIHLNSPGPLPSDDHRQIELWREKYNLGRPVGARAATWASYRETANGAWYDDPKNCPVAPIFRLGIYMINDLVRIFGPADRVQVMQTRLFTGRPTSDNAQLGIQFKNGALASVFASFCIDDGIPYTDALELNFEKGTIQRNFGRVALGKVDKSTTLLSLVRNSGGGRPVIEHAEVQGMSGQYQWEAFARAVRSGGPLEGEISPDLVVAGLKIITAMSRSEESGRPEEVA